jgi:hypothetical protein
MVSMFYKKQLEHELTHNIFESWTKNHKNDYKNFPKIFNSQGCSPNGKY